MTHNQQVTRVVQTDLLVMLSMSGVALSSEAKSRICSSMLLPLLRATAAHVLLGDKHKVADPVLAS